MISLRAIHPLFLFISFLVLPYCLSFISYHLLPLTISLCPYRPSFLTSPHLTTPLLSSLLLAITITSPSPSPLPVSTLQIVTGQKDAMDCLVHLMGGGFTSQPMDFLSSHLAGLDAVRYTSNTYDVHHTHTCTYRNIYPTLLIV